jgi:hypothetical protein
VDKGTDDVDGFCLLIRFTVQGQEEEGLGRTTRSMTEARPGVGEVRHDAAGQGGGGRDAAEDCKNTPAWPPAFFSFPRATPRAWRFPPL